MKIKYEFCSSLHYLRGEILYKVGDKLRYIKCSCGDDLIVGNLYTVIGIKNGLFMFLDDNGNKRVRNLNSKCFEKVDDVNE